MQNCSSNLVKPGKTAHLHRKMAIRNRLMLMTKFPVCSYNRKKAKVLTQDLVCTRGCWFRPYVYYRRRNHSFGRNRLHFWRAFLHFRPFVFRTGYVKRIRRSIWGSMTAKYWPRKNIIKSQDLAHVTKFFFAWDIFFVNLTSDLKTASGLIAKTSKTMQKVGLALRWLLPWPSFL